MSLGLVAELPPSGPRMFFMIREAGNDVSGVSERLIGSGIIAEGMQFTDGTCTVRWRGRWPTTNTYPCIEAVEDIHGHSGQTYIHWLTPDRVLDRCIP